MFPPGQPVWGAGPVSCFLDTGDGELLRVLVLLTEVSFFDPGVGGKLF
jgi:hypothetical protein